MCMYVSVLSIYSIDYWSLFLSNSVSVHVSEHHHVRQECTLFGSLLLTLLPFLLLVFLLYLLSPKPIILVSLLLLWLFLGQVQIESAQDGAGASGLEGVWSKI